MARRRFYRIKRVYPRKKWASNYNEFDFEATSTFPQGGGTAQTAVTTNYSVLAINAPQLTVSPTPVILKVGNFKIRGSINQFTTQPTNPANTISSCKIYCMFVPEGINLDDNTTATRLPQQHPEWIMGWTVIDSGIVNGTATDLPKFSITSRLKRNLNSGDRVVLLYSTRTRVTYGTAETNIDSRFAGTVVCQYFTCAN